MFVLYFQVFFKLWLETHRWGVAVPCYLGPRQTSWMPECFLEEGSLFQIATSQWSTTVYWILFSSKRLPKGSQKASLLTQLPVWLEATSSLFCGPLWGPQRPIECVSTPAHPRRGNWGILKAFQHHQDHCVATHHGKQCATMPKRLGTTVLYY